MILPDDHSAMKLCLEEAKKAYERGEVPIGAALVHAETRVLAASNGNRTRELKDPTAHAEILVIREVCQKEDAQRIPDYILYVTLEPCAMCAAAIAFARIPRLVFGAQDEKGGGVLHGPKFYNQPTCHHKIEVEHGLLEAECSQILKDFFAERRKA